MVTAWRMNEWHEINYIFDKKFGTAIIEFVITMAATVMFDLTIAILIGVFLAIMIYVVKNSELHINASPVDMNRIKGHECSTDHSNTKIIYLTGPLFFMTSQKLNQISAHAEDVQNIIISMRAVTTIDESAIGEFKQIINRFNESDKTILFCGLQANVKDMFDRSGLTNIIKEELFFWDAIEALKYLQIIQIEDLTV